MRPRHPVMMEVSMSPKVTKRKRRLFTPEFKAEAVVPGARHRALGLLRVHGTDVLRHGGVTEHVTIEVTPPSPRPFHSHAICAATLHVPVEPQCRPRRV